MKIVGETGGDVFGTFRLHWEYKSISLNGDRGHSETILFFHAAFWHTKTGFGGTAAVIKRIATRLRAHLWK